MAFAIALHNFPEGIVIGAGFALENGRLIDTGMLLALLVGLHNVPVGMATSIPLVSGGMSRTRAILIAAICGVPTVLGAWLGLWIGNAWSFGLMAILGFSSGAVLYLVFGEIIPESILMYRSKLPAFFIMLGILIGLFIIYI